MEEIVKVLRQYRKLYLAAVEDESFYTYQINTISLISLSLRRALKGYKAPIQWKEFIS